MNTLLSRRLVLLGGGTTCLSSMAPRHAMAQRAQQDCVFSRLEPYRSRQ